MSRSRTQFRRPNWIRLVFIGIILVYGLYTAYQADRGGQEQNAATNGSPASSQTLPEWAQQATQDSAAPAADAETVQPADAEPEPAGPTAGTHVVRRVVDGDTLLLETGQRIRLIGVDTPETVAEDRPVEPWGPEASAFATEFIAAGGNRVRLEFDAERQDQYGRYLAYVWVGNQMLNEELLRQGLGRPLLRFPYADEKKRIFRQAADEARAAGRGIYSN